jgi:hypothetical protein
MRKARMGHGTQALWNQLFQSQRELFFGRCMRGQTSNWAGLSGFAPSALLSNAL